MVGSTKIFNRFIASLLCVCMFAMNAPVALFADEFISGVDPSGNTYNIEAEKISGDTGFRHYDNFYLQNDYVANLIYKDSYSKFVNLVDSQITIDGIVNTMKGGNFYNGHAIFVSPNGMVVGSSGLLNVGSLSVLTPSQDKFNDFKSEYFKSAYNLSSYVVGGSGYNGLITDSHGNIVINGKILSRGDVNLFGDTIAIQGLDGNKAGVVAGWQDSNTSFSDLQSAKNTFNSLVSNNITDATNFALKDGKIKIVAGYKELDENNKPDGIAKKAEVYIENAQIGASEVEVKANSTREYDTFDVFDDDNDGKHYDLADADDAISSKITIKDSSVAGESVDIAATSQAALSRDINMSIPTVFWWLFDGDDAKIADFFDGGIYDGFEGARTSAVIDIVDSAIQATKNDLSITSSAISNTSISSTIGEVIPHIFYGYGTKTESKINIKNSSLKAKNDVVLNALSQNVMQAAIANNGAVSIQAENAYDFAFASNSTSADTKITIDHSTVEGHDVSALAFAYNKLKNKVDLRALIGANDFAYYGQNGQEGQGGSGAVADVLMNDTDIQSAVEVLNGSSVTASNDVTLNAYNINEVNNNVTSKTLDPTGYQKRYEDPDGWWHKFLNKTRVLGGEIKQWTNFSFGEMRNLFSNKINNTKNIWNHSIDDGLDKKASFQVGAGALFNNSKTTNNVIINNSTINAGKDINIKAHTVDLTANVAAALAKQGDAAKVGGAFSFSLNDQQNDNKVDIIDSIIKTSGSGSTINVDSIVELPSQQGTLGVSMKFPEVVAKSMNKAGYWIGKSVGINTYDDEDWKGDLTLSMDFNFGAQDNLGFGFHTPDQDAPSSGFIPDIGIFGFFNNFAIASAAGEKVGLSGAVAINNIENNSDINVTDSTIEKVDALAKNGGIYMNSVVSASVHDAIDFIGSVSILLVSSLKDWQNASGATAIGGSVLVQNFNNNARTTVDNSAIDAKGGNLELNSAAEQAYLNLLTPGGKANTVGVAGAISVQSIKGTTSSTVKGNSTLNAGNISVSSGKAKAALSKKNTDIAEDSIHLLDDEGKFSLGEAREVKDHVTTAAFDGSLVKQSQSGQDPSSFGVAVGASVIVKTIDRTVKTSIVDSVLTANKKIDVASTSYNKDFIVTVAAAHVGGVSTDRARQEQANQNANNGNQNPQAEDQPQEMQDVGNWMDIMDNAGPDAADVMNLNDLFNDNNPNQQGAANAQGQAGGNQQMAQGVANPQNATNNFSLALAGAVSVLNDESVVQTEIKNSTLRTGDELNVSSSRDNFLLNLTGGGARAGNFGGGAAVNVYADKGAAKSIIEGSTIEFWSDAGYNEKKFNVSATSEHRIIEAAVGVGVAKNDQNGVKAAVGGSFNANTLKDTTEAKVVSTTIPKKHESAKDIDVNVKADAKTTIWSGGGDAAYAGGNNSSFAVGAGVAGNMELIKQTVNSEIINSTLSGVKDVVNSAEAVYDINSIGVAAAVVTGAQSSFTIDGVLGLDFIQNNISAKIKNSTISSSGDVKNKAASTIKGRTLTGGADISTVDSSAGVGIGAVIEIDNSKVIAELSDSKILKSKSVEVSADSSDKRQFLAANLGVQTGSSSVAINANGIVGVIKTTVNALVSGASEISSDGDVKVSSVYDNENEGITAVVDKAGKLALGANIIANYYENDTKSEISSSSKIKKAKNIEVSAKTREKIDLIPVAASIASGGAVAVAADVVVNIIKDKTEAKAVGDLTATQNLKVAADGETTINNRGGTLALDTGMNGGAVIGGAINVDYIAKIVNAQIGDKDFRSHVNAGGVVSATALSTNSFGGTPVKKGGDGEYERKDITSDSYQDSLVGKDGDGKYKLKYDSDFENWNMFYNLSAGGGAAVAGTVIVKTIDNAVNSEILNADVNNPKTVRVIASDYSIKNIIAGEITASKNGAIGVQTVITNDKSKTTALVTNSNIKAKKFEESKVEESKVEVLAKNQKDNNQIVAAGSFSKSLSVGANVLVNTINDLVMAKIDSSEVTSDALNVNAEEDISSTRIVVAASAVAQGAAINVSPLVNYYGDSSSKNDGESDEAYEQRRKGKTIAQISNSTIKDAKIDVLADTNIKTWDLAVGVAGAGEGFAASGLAIKNTYDTKTKALIDKSSTINTEKDIALNANSVANSHNMIIGASGIGIGATAIVNVIINNMVSEVTAKIDGSEIVKAGNISLNANKGKKDELKNYAFSASGTGEGASVVANVMYNIYDNKVASEIANSSIVDSYSINVNAFSDRNLYNYNVGVAVVGLGGALVANAIVNNVRTETLANVKSIDKNIKTSNALSVVADDNTKADNTIGFGGGGAGAAGANINLFYSDNLAKAEVASTTGQIQAGSAQIKSTTTNAMQGETVGFVAGLAGIAGDVEVIRLGKAADYTGSDTASGIDEANKKTEKSYNDIMGNDAKYYKPTDSSKAETGSVARVSGKLKSQNDVTVKAESKVKGFGKDEILKLDNVGVSVGIGNVNVGVKKVKIANNTIAEIDGGTVESQAGKVTVDAKNTAKVKIDSVDVNVSGVKVSGGSEVYDNSSNTVAQIVDSTVTGDGVDVLSKSTSHGKINAVHRVVALGNVVGVDLSEAKDENTTSALISGNTNIDAKTGKLSVHATADTDLESKKNTVNVEAVSLVNVAKNIVNASSVTQALIKNVTGEINAKGIDIVSDYNKMSAYASSNITSVSTVSAADWEKGGAVMNATFSSGIDSPAGLEIVNDGQTLIETAKSLGSEKISAKSVINKTSVKLVNLYAGTFAEAENTAKSNTFLKAKDHSAKSLLIDAMLDSVADAYLDDEMYSLLDVNSLETYAKNTSKLNIDVFGKNSIENTAVINAINNANANSNLSAINVGVTVSGLRVRVNSEVTADTVANIGGDFSFDSADIAVNTKRNSVMSKGSKSGGLISVGDAKASNKLEGKSELNIIGLNIDLSSNNALAIKNNATNTFDITSKSSSGGVINVSEDNTDATLNSNVVTNIIDSVINSNKKVLIESKNDTIVKDSAVTSGGGFVTIIGLKSDKNYTANAKLSFKNSMISASEIGANVLSGIRPQNGDGYLDYDAENGGFVAKDCVEVKNTFNQKAELELINSKLLASNDAKLSAQTSSLFKQSLSSKANGFVSLPRSKSYLTSYNTQSISLDSASMVLAKDEAKFNLDSSNTLVGHVESIAKNFAGTPLGESYVTAVINNTLDNSGTIKAGNLVDINFMEKSNSDLRVEVTVKNSAAVASTSKDGMLTRTINNTLNVNDGAQIVSDKSIGIHYSDGFGSLESVLYSKSTSYLLFGIPIVKTDTKRPITDNGQDVFNLYGKVIAGNSTEKYMKINNDGSVDLYATTGFAQDDYRLILYDDNWEKMKVAKKESINDKLAKINEDISSYEGMQSSLNASMADCDSQATELNETIDEINAFINNQDGSHIILNSEADENGAIEFHNAIFADFKQNVCDNSENPEEGKISEASYDAMMAGYNEYLKNLSSDEDGSLAVSLSAYLKTYTPTDQTNVLTDAQKTTLLNVASQIGSNLKENKGDVFTYQKINSNVTYIGLKDLVKDGQTGKVTGCGDLTVLANSINELTEKKLGLSQQYEDLDSKIANLTSQIQPLNKELQNVDKLPDPNANGGIYSVEFSDTKYPESKIDITGIKNTDIKGNGTFETGKVLFKVDNYSTRSLIFNNIDTTDIPDLGLYINNESYASYADSPLAVNSATNGTEGVHFVTHSSSGESGIIVNNYYDNTNPYTDIESPYKDLLDVPNEKSASDILFKGAVETAAGLKVFNDSGSIYFEKLDTSLIQNAIELFATKGDVQIQAADNTKLVLTSEANIFAGNSVSIAAADYDIDAKITAGYSNDLNLTITDAMLNKLSFDPTTGHENLLIDLGEKPWLNEKNNIKALYDSEYGRIMLFDINEPFRPNVDVSQRGKINISPGSSASTINMDKVKGYEGLQTVTIKNETDKDLSVYNVCATGNINIDSNGDILQWRAVLSYEGKTSIKSKGNTESMAPIGSAGDILIENTGNAAGTILESILLTTKGNIYVKNSMGGIVMYDGASLLNYSSPNGSEKYGIFIENSNENSAIYLFGGTIYNEGGGDIVITNKGDGGGQDIGLFLSTEIENTKGDIIINNANSNIALGNYSHEDTPILKTDEGNIVINQVGGNIGNMYSIYTPVIESGGNLTINVTDGNIGVVEDEIRSAIKIKVLGSVESISANDIYADMNVLGSVKKLTANYADVNLSGLGVIDVLRANNANINCSEIRFALNDGIINNYAEFRNKSKTAVVSNNDLSRVDYADIQLYTAKTGSFSLILDDTINMRTNAPVVYNNPDMLANGYSSEGNFVTKGQKETKVLYESVKSLEAHDNANAGGKTKKPGAIRLDASKNKALTADFTVYELSTDGAVVMNDKNLEKGDITAITFDLSDVTVNARVIDVADGKASLEFIDMTKEDEDKFYDMFNSLVQ